MYLIEFKLEIDYHQIAYLGSSVENPLSDLCFASDADSVILPDFLHKFILSPSLCEMVYLESLFSERRDSVHADVLEQQKLDFILVRRSKYSRLADVKTSRFLAEAFMDSTLIRGLGEGKLGHFCLGRNGNGDRV